MNALPISIKKKGNISMTLKNQFKQVLPISEVNKIQQNAIDKKLRDDFIPVCSFNIKTNNLKTPLQSRFINHDNTFIDDWGINDNADILETLKEINKHLPDKVKQILFSSGIDLKKIIEQSIQIPEHTKAIKNCEQVINTLQKYPCIPTIKLDYKGKQIYKVDEVTLKKNRRSLEEYLINTKENSLPLNEEVKNKMRDLEKIYQCSLAESFKKVNIHNLKKDLSEIGINSIKVTGDGLYIFMNNEMGRVLKITANVGSFIVNLYDNIWRSNNFKIDDPANDDLTPLEILNSKKAIERRDALVKRNTSIMMSMIKYIDDKRTLNNEKKQLVASLLKGYRCSEQVIKQNIENKNLVEEILNERMTKFYNI